MSNHLILFKAYQDMSEAEGLDAVFDISLMTAQNLGFEYVAYGCFTGEASLEDRQPAVRLNYPGDWVEEYFEEQLFECDPVVQNVSKLGRATDWSSLAQNKKERGFLKRAASAGLAHGMSVPLNGPFGGRFVFSLGGGDEISLSRAFMGSQLANVAHSALLDQVGPNLGYDFKLTSGQKRVLRALADGCSREEVADHLDISLDGVDYHLKRARQVMGTNSTLHTVSTAVRLGLI